MTASPYDLFISYADADRAWVEGYLLYSLAEAGINYHSQKAFTLGAPRVAEFERAVQQSKRIVLILSPAYLADGSSKFIDLLAQTHGLDSATWPVIPLQLQPTTLPPRLAMLTGLDATDPTQWEVVVKRLCAEFKGPLPAETLKPQCPYPGMRSFEENDSARFFGRDAEVEEIKNQLRLHPFITVIGPSGSGKSSLVFAGLVPGLRRTQLFGPGEWDVRRMRPGETPSATLEKLLEGTSLDPKQAMGKDVATENRARLLLVVDQFEEVFTLAGDEGPSFQERLLSLVGSVSLYVVLTVRADFYPELMASTLWPQMRLHRQEVLPLSEDGLRQAILRPSEEVGVFVESALVERLVSDAAGEPGILPFVQETLRLLWEHVERRLLPLHAYEALVLPRKAYGGIDQRKLTGLQVAMARHADIALTDLDEQKRSIARRIFLRLVQFGEGRADTRRQQSVEALRVAGDDPDNFTTTLRHLADRRLITLGGEETDLDAKVDIAHEALIAGWQTLQQWISERRESELSRRRLESKAQEWTRFGKGAGGLLDEAELAEAERYMKSPDALELGSDVSVKELIERSWTAIREAEREKEEVWQRELNLQVKANKAARTRNRVAAVLLVLLTGLTIYAFIQTNRAERNAQEAKRQSVFNLSKLSQFYLTSNQQIEALVTALDAGQRLKETNWNAAEPPIEAVIALQQALYVGRERNRFQGHQGGVTSISLNSDGKLIASAGNDKTVKLWRADGKLLKTFSGHERELTEVEFSPNDQTIASTGFDQTIRLWDLEGNARMIIRVGDPNGQQVSLISSLTFSPDGQKIAAACLDKTVRLWSVADGALLKTFNGHQGKVIEVTFIPKKDLLASVGDDEVIFIWNLNDNGQRTIQARSGTVFGVASAPDGETIATAGEDKTVKLWSLDGTLKRALEQEDSVVNVRFSPDGRSIASASMDGTVRLWSLDDDSEQIFRGHQGGVAAVRFSRDGQSILSAGNDGSIRVWGLDGQLPTLIHEEPINNIEFSPDGKTLASSSDDHSIKLWNLEGSLLQTLKGANALVLSINFSPDGKTIVSSEDMTVRIWDLNGGVKTLGSHGDTVRGVSFSPDGKTVASGSTDRTVKLWNLNGELLRTLDNGSEVNNVSFSPDGQTIASACADKTIRLWTTNGELLQILEGHEDRVLTVRFSADGNLIASGDSNNGARLWQRNGKRFDLRSTMRGHSASIYSIAFSPVDAVLATSSGDGTIKFWSLDGQLLQTLRAHSDAVFDVSFSPNGKSIASASYDGKAILWNLDLDDLMARGCRRLRDYLSTNSVLSERDRGVCANFDGSPVPGGK
jgi:WD40 repeat protein